MAITTAFKKIKAAIYEPTFYKIIQGGMSAGKTFAILTILIGYAQSYDNSVVTVVGMTHGHLAKGAIRDFKKIMVEQKIWDDEKWNKSESTYTFGNGSIVEFMSVDKMGAHGLRRNVLFMNECNGATYETARQLFARTSDFVICDYNPSAKFWAHTEIVENKKHDGDVSFLVLTYKDNEALSPREVENIESEAPKAGEEPSNWWVVYGLGQIGSLEGNVYSGWIETDEDEIKKSGKLVRYGLDFGFSNDETAMLSTYDLGDNKIGAIEEIYQKKMLASQYGEIFEEHGIDKNTLIIADSARPEIIAEIKHAGYRCIGADKNAGSVKRGIDRVSERQIFYAGKNIGREYLSYHWRTNHSGETLGEPQDGHDHLMDALRYAIDDLKKQRFDF